ncbi:hypothetical protein SLA2020_367160 [Shorea laevis]
MTGCRCWGLLGPVAPLMEDDDDVVVVDEDDADDGFFMRWESLLIFRGGVHKPLLLIISLFAWNCAGLMILKAEFNLLLLFLEFVEANLEGVYMAGG